MLVHRKKKAQYGVHIPLTPLIDIVFLLLIYFLLTTNFLKNDGLDVKLPEAKLSGEQAQTELVISIDRYGKIFFENSEVNTEELYTKLNRVLSDSKDSSVIIKADREVLVGKAVIIMDIAKGAGAKRLALATEKPKEAP